MNQKSFLLELENIIWSLPDEVRGKFINSFTEQGKNPVIAFGLSAFLGFFGIDIFYIGDTMLGVIKLITLGGFGIWSLIDLFLIAGLARDKNIRIARELKGSFSAIKIK
ncbi:hypothetical protein CFR78_14345 [Komagataeibacter rhaeticus]|uniref:TM2 domain-containing protein n=1 Tax=Komagataeibacter rhaeticus TaxID=215221 RepID=UPI000DA0EFE8|nr:TM2 domain-containing protein [Komagataeibacter rhaeticus]MBL7241463.1 TM2 domain-containing protein [Komagataeibacter rhaeticus]PYD52527.1 hypothetical protein CFR78_14345 [Komagataeibacter rhaeticus]GBQ13301.1 TM2 domain-containing protein [Komagataeibacter rhaeticus DSM 16663]